MVKKIKTIVTFCNCFYKIIKQTCWKKAIQGRPAHRIQIRMWKAAKREPELMINLLPVLCNRAWLSSRR